MEGEAMSEQGDKFLGQIRSSATITIVDLFDGHVGRLYVCSDGSGPAEQYADEILELIRSTFDNRDEILAEEFPEVES